MTGAPQTTSQFGSESATRLREAGLARISHGAVNTFPGLVHTARQAMGAGVPEVRNRKDRPRVKQQGSRTGSFRVPRSYEVLIGGDWPIPEGAAGDLLSGLQVSAPKVIRGIDRCCAAVEIMFIYRSYRPGGQSERKKNDAGT